MIPDTLILDYSHQFVGIFILTVCMVEHNSYIPGMLFSSFFPPTVSSQPAAKGRRHGTEHAITSSKEQVRRQGRTVGPTTLYQNKAGMMKAIRKLTSNFFRPRIQAENWVPVLEVPFEIPKFGLKA